MQVKETINNKGVEIFFNGNFKKAEDKFREAIKTDKNDSSAYNNLAFILQQKRKLQEAEQMARKSLHINPASSSAWLNLGNILVQQEKSEEGIKCITQAIELNIENVFAWESLATIATLQQDFAAAEKCWEKILALKPAESKYWVQSALIKAALKNYDAAILCLDIAIKKNENDAFAWSQLGIMELVRQNYGLAEKSLLRSLSLSPDDENTRYHLALVYISKNEIENAKSEFDKILYLNSTNVKVITEKGILELGTGNNETARFLLKQALKIEPGYKKAVEYLERIDMASKT